MELVNSEGFADVTFVVPCYNEISSVDRLIHEISEIASQQNLKFVIVANGSTDGTTQKLQLLLAGKRNIDLCIVPQNLGYGFGIFKGLEQTDTKWVGWFHADLQIPTSALIQIADLALSQNSCVKGYRIGRKISERLFTTGMSIFCSAIFRKLMRDVNGQPTLYKRDLIFQVPTPPNDFSFDLHYYFHALDKRLKILRPRVRMYPRQTGISSWNTGVKSQVRMTRRTIRYILGLRRNLND